MKHSFEFVIHKNHGGFYLTDRIVKALRDMDSELVQNFGQEHRATHGLWWHPRQDKEEFRAHPDLLEVVKLLTDQLESLSEDASWEERAKLERKLLYGLKVSKVDVEFDIIEDDGKEHVVARGHGY